MVAQLVLGVVVKELLPNEFKKSITNFYPKSRIRKVKTRLAKSVGDKTALDIYHFLLHKTKEATKNISCDKTVYYLSLIHI